MITINVTDIADSRNLAQPGAVEAIAQIISAEIESGNSVMVVKQYSNAPDDCIATLKTIKDWEDFMRPYMD